MTASGMYITYLSNDTAGYGLLHFYHNSRPRRVGAQCQVCAFRLYRLKRFLGRGLVASQATWRKRRGKDQCRPNQTSSPRPPWLDPQTSLPAFTLLHTRALGVLPATLSFHQLVVNLDDLLRTHLTRLPLHSKSHPSTFLTVTSLFGNFFPCVWAEFLVVCNPAWQPMLLDMLSAEPVGGCAWPGPRIAGVVSGIIEVDAGVQGSGRSRPCTVESGELEHVD